MKSRTTTAALISVLAAMGGGAQAQTVNVGTMIGSPLVQAETLSNGNDITLATTVFENAAGLYTYQYELTNLTDPDGLALFAPTVSGASDFGTSGLTFFFGGAAVGGNVTVDGTVGNDLTNTGFGPGVFNAAGTARADGFGSRIDFETVPSLAAGSSNVSQLGDYYYIQSHSGPGSADINVVGGGAADFGAPTPNAAPAVPEASTASLVALGGLGLMGLALRARRKNRTA